MTEAQVMNEFYSFMISNSLYNIGGLFLLWVAFRAAVRINDEGAPLLNKIVVTVFGISVVAINLQTQGYLEWVIQGTVNELATLASLSPSGQSFVDTFGVTESANASLIPTNPFFIVFWLSATVMFLGSVWTEKKTG